MADQPKLLDGGNPQIAKGDGDAPVQAYLDAIPAGWKQDICRRFDALVAATVPGARKRVRWNTPFYGAPDDQGWFLAFNLTTCYVKVAFFAGTQLDPPPPVGSQQPQVRYLHLHDGEWSGEQLTDWIRQASRLPGAMR